MKFIFSFISGVCVTASVYSQNQHVQVVQNSTEKRINVSIGGKQFTQFLFPDTLEKPVLYPITAGNGTKVTRGFPMDPQPLDPTDHPHHLGLWLNFENVNGLDFWNNSYAIPQERKNKYGWIRTDRIIETKSGKIGVIAYHANWTNQANDILLEENTRYEFSGNDHRRIIDRVTTLTANTEVKFTDAKDGLLGLRVAHALEIPAKLDKKFTDDKGIVTVVKSNADEVANGNYVTSAGKTGDSAWSTRAVWCKMYGKMDADSVSIVIIDHPKNPNYPTFWHARGYGLFAANPLGEKIFTNNKSEKNLTLQKGQSVTFRFRVVVANGKRTISNKEIDQLANAFGKM